MNSEFTVRYVQSVAPRLALSGSINTRMYDPVGVHPVNLGAVYYRIGGHYLLTKWLLVEIEHGSVHNIDRAGPTQLYNRVGLLARRTL